MYLPTFQKLTFELVGRRARTAMLCGGVIMTTVVPTLFYNQIYNLIYTDIIPPKPGVERRVEEE